MKMGQNSFTNGCIMNVPKILFREFTGCKDGVRVLILHSDTSILQREIPCDQSHDSLPSGPPLVCMFNNQGATKWPLFWYTFCCIGGFGWILGVDFFGILRIPKIAGFLHPRWRLSLKIRRSKKHLISSTRMAQAGNSLGKQCITWGVGDAASVCSFGGHLAALNFSWLSVPLGFPQKWLFSKGTWWWDLISPAFQVRSIPRSWRWPWGPWASSPRRKRSRRWFLCPGSRWMQMIFGEIAWCWRWCQAQFLWKWSASGTVGMGLGMVAFFFSRAKFLDVFSEGAARNIFRILLLKNGMAQPQTGTSKQRVMRMWMTMVPAPLAMRSSWRWWPTKSWTAIQKTSLGVVACLWDGFFVLTPLTPETMVAGCQFLQVFVGRSIIVYKFGTMFDWTTSCYFLVVKASAMNFMKFLFSKFCKFGV